MDAFWFGFHFTLGAFSGAAILSLAAWFLGEWRVKRKEQSRE